MFRSSCAVPVQFTSANKGTLWPMLLSIQILNHLLLSHLSFLKQKKEDFLNWVCKQNKREEEIWAKKYFYNAWDCSEYCK